VVAPLKKAIMHSEKTHQMATSQAIKYSTPCQLQITALRSRLR